MSKLQNGLLGEVMFRNASVERILRATQKSFPLNKKSIFKYTNLAHFQKNINNQEKAKLKFGNSSSSQKGTLYQQIARQTIF